MNIIEVTDLVPMDVFEGDFPIRVDIVYADENHPENIFKQRLYKKDARLWLYKDLVPVVLLASKMCYKDLGYVMVLKDGLRTVDAQELMKQTDIVKANPHWYEDGPNRLLSPPGEGAHPRGMAIDITLEKEDGSIIDMGTSFDYLHPDPGANPSHRDYRDFPAFILNNRKNLKNVMVKASYLLKQPVIPLPAEWWDFRFPKGLYETYMAIKDKDLPLEMQMTDCQAENAIMPLSKPFIEGVKNKFTEKVEKVLAA
jgi:D-alanyl-D-alanine dipeptidase